MRSFILEEGVLNDNELYIAEDGKVFKGGFIAIVKEYVFQNAWCNREIVKRFRSWTAMEKYITRKYPEFEIYDL